MALRHVLAIALAGALIGACGDDGDGGKANTPNAEPATSAAGPTTTVSTVPASPFEVSSPAFADGAPIPVRYTCDDASLIPPLKWSGVPSDAVELALVVDDPDAPRAGGFVHWVAWGIDPDGEVVEGEPIGGAVDGSNGTGNPGWIGPCPPPGDEPHHYRFHLYALSARPDVEPGATAEQLRDVIADITVADDEYVGTYQRA